jgi:Ran GTPase-activating protein (RanGAP) involved in mRNA processing and transport
MPYRDITEALLALKKNPDITELDLMYCDIDDNGARTLAEALKDYRFITELDLRQNKISDDGAIALAEALYNNNHHLKTLRLGRNHIGDNGAMSFIPYIYESRSLEKLSFFESNIGDAGVMALIAASKNSTSLKELNLGMNKATFPTVSIALEIAREKHPPIIRLFPYEITPPPINETPPLSTLDTSQREVISPSTKQDSRLCSHVK